MAKKQNILITGGAGFIGSHVVLEFVKKYPHYKIINFDILSYAADLNYVAEVSNAPNYHFEKGDLRERKTVQKIFYKYDFDAVIHLAAESHVDNSIKDPLGFASTNVMGTLNLLETARNHWGNHPKNKRFYHISTDEVFGSLEDQGSFSELTAYDPRSPYSASKAASDHFVRAYFHTYGLPVVLSNCSNNYGPHQFPEKLIPLFIKNIVEQKPLPVYGTGKNIRDWLYVEDHAKAIDLIFHKGKNGETYAVGGNNEIRNIDLVEMIIKIIDKKLNNPQGSSTSLIEFVEDRLGHDYRYAINTTKIEQQLGWSPKTKFEEGLSKTVSYFLSKFSI
ncbi:MAG: dTDP-glucose 4,6-dehydratase [Flavobacteriales bacterium MED-G22]|nr:MAG: dTDP-glucose 4,6-dehydratase [Flavobacteriales bacterium MED-G22]